MPSPFPGMDPYLENPAHFRGVHLSLLFEIRRVLNRDLPPAYYCDVDEQIFITPPRRAISPDASVTRIDAGKSANIDGGSVAVRTAQTRLATKPIHIVFDEEILRRRFLQIRTTDPANRLVTVIEVLSPTNKQKGEHQTQYQKKQNELLYTDAHLLEIDLLRAGSHTVAVPLTFITEEKPDFDYVVSLHRAGQFWGFDVWAFTVRELLPVVTVPLAEGDPDVLLDMGEVVAGAYAASPYVPLPETYKSEPVPRLDKSAKAWADALLREKGLRQ